MKSVSPPNSASEAVRRRILDLNAQIDDLATTMKEIADATARHKFASDLARLRLKKERIRTIIVCAKVKNIQAELDIIMASSDVVSELGSMKRKRVGSVSPSAKREKKSAGSAEPTKQATKNAESSEKAQKNYSKKQHSAARSHTNGTKSKESATKSHYSATKKHQSTTKDKHCTAKERVSSAKENIFSAKAKELAKEKHSMNKDKSSATKSHYSAPKSYNSATQTQKTMEKAPCRPKAPSNRTQTEPSNNLPRNEITPQPTKDIPKAPTVSKYERTTGKSIVILQHPPVKDNSRFNKVGYFTPEYAKKMLGYIPKDLSFDITRKQKSYNVTDLTRCKNVKEVPSFSKGLSMPLI